MEGGADDEQRLLPLRHDELRRPDPERERLRERHIRFRGLPTASAGVRVDDHSEFGSVATYKLSLSCPVPRNGAALKGSVGTGFRAPSLNELYYPGYGNPALAPERTAGYDIGFRRDFAAGRASISNAPGSTTRTAT